MTRIAFRLSRIVVTTLALLFLAQSARAEVVDFNDLSLPAESAFDPGGPGVPSGAGEFTSGGASFGYQITNFKDFGLDYGFASGFSYSNKSDTTTGDFTNPYSAITGVGHTSVPAGTVDIYGVSFGYQEVAADGSLTTAQIKALPYIGLPAGKSIVDAYVTNTTYAALTMRDGNSFSTAFGGADGTAPDFFKLTAYGETSSGDLLSQTVSMMLADYTSSDSSQDYILTDWTRFDLSALSGATRIYFNVSSSDVGINGMNTPAYFAIDDISFRGATAVPEPASIALLMTGGLGLVFMRRKKKTA